MRCWPATCSLVFVGCSLVTSTDPLDPAEGHDAGADDRGPADGGAVGRDAGALEPADGGAPGCLEGESRCEDTVLVMCVAGLEERVECGEAGCGGDPADCTARACKPGGRSCEGDELVVCTDIGTFERTLCEFGCDSAALACSAPSACDVVDDIGSGSEEFDTCELSDSSAPDAMADCEGGANGRDVVLRLEVDRDRLVRLALRDIDEGTAIDTVLYLRTACDDPSSQVECANNEFCATCPGFSARGRSSLTPFLRAGTYFVVVDSYDYADGERTFGCGRVRLEVSFL